MVYRIP